MRPQLRILFCSLILTVAIAGVSFAQSDNAARYAEPFPAHHVIGNIYFVGSAGVASFLITTSQGDILINSDLESQSAPLIQQSIEGLGSKLSDVKILLISHAHYDHCTGSALIKELTGAKYMVMNEDVPTIESGGNGKFPPAKVDRVLHDGDEVRLGDTVLVAHLTPGHTKGNTTWTTTVSEGGKTYNVVIVGSASVNASTAKLVNDQEYPQVAADFERTFRVLKSLPCDVFLGSHTTYYGMAEKFARLKQVGPNPFIDPDGYKKFVADKEQVFLSELKKQKAAAN